MEKFHGSYDSGDVTFLLKPVTLAPTDVAAKERAIQSGQAHYSEMLSVEKSPDPRYLSLFHRALAANGVKLAAHLASLARTLAARPGQEIVLVSLARAGTPIGVLLNRALKAMNRRSTHYCASIIRDRGIDWVALDHILAAGHSDTDIVFVDGWTGKGVISAELARSVGEYNRRSGTSIDTTLAVVADLAGTAGLAATEEDYLIPSAVLNSIVSGLVSRTVLRSDLVGPRDFHACVFYEDKRGEDLSRFYVDALTEPMLAALTNHSDICRWTADTRRTLSEQSEGFVSQVMDAFGVDNRNHVKPGIGESTRALLRRVPERLMLRDPQAQDVEHLVALAQVQGVPISHDPQMPYRAAVIIKSLD